MADEKPKRFTSTIGPLKNAVSGSRTRKSEPEEEGGNGST